MAELLGRPDYRQPACERGLLWCPGWAPWSHTDFTNDIVLVRLAGRPLPPTRKIAPISVGSQLVSPGSFFVRSLPNDHIKGTVSQDFQPLFFWSKTLPGHHIKRQKRFRDIVRFREDIHEKCVSAKSLTTLTCCCCC